MRDSVEDLSALLRRGELDVAERRRLELALGSSSEAQLLHRAGLELDQAGSMLPGDDALAERVKRRVMARVLPARASRRRWFLPWGIAAAVACVAVAAGGAVVGLRPLRALLSLPVLSTPSGATSPRRAAEPPPRPAPPTHGSAQAVQIDALPAPTPVPSAPGAASKSSAGAPDASSASELFANAASARRRGKAQEAMLLYDALQSRFPGSAEANAADMALGMLRLQRGSPRSALEHFTRYLSRNPRAELVPDALWGKAQALSSLGLHAEARRSYGSLVQRYPDSTYAAAARAKLEASKPEP
jgi:TolA-binding protein